MREVRSMDRATAIDLVERYYAAFNARDLPTFFSLLADDVVHDVNQGGRESGIAAFRAFMDLMNAHYSEELVDMVVMANEDGTRASAEFVVLGEYRASAAGLPVAANQSYRLPAGAFFDVRDGKIARVTNYYNLTDWIAQVEGA